jgi:4-hydroxy-tetrahydrodipicolinate synthase
MEKLQGVLIPMIIPMFEDDRLDLAGTQRLTERFLSLPSTDGIFALGVTSECMHLPFGERKELIRLYGEVDRRDKVITVNTGGLDMKEVIELTELVGKVGLDAAAVVIPDDVSDSVEAVTDYLQKIGSTGVPFAIYWSPSISKHRSSTALVRNLVEMPNFVGLKDSSQNMVTFTEICALYGSQISVFQGVEMLHLASLAVGSAGVVGGGLNLYPGLAKRITEAFEKRDFNLAVELQQKVKDSWDYIFRERAYRSICKNFWRAEGVIEGIHCREGANLQISDQEMERISAIAAL